jgi:2-dehydro-3-deoxygalactonokinase
MAKAALLACDWGTTNLRAWTLDAQGRLVADREFALGVSAFPAGEAARLFREQVRPSLDAVGLPAILCGMIGSNLGWTLAPYVDCPAGLEILSRELTAAPDGGAPVAIVPGMRSRGVIGGVDVMRGEETQLFGWLAQNPERRIGRQVVCHPGTHAKWMVVEAGRLTRFATAMTGELFAVLGKYSVLKCAAPADDEADFVEGLDAAGDGDALAARLFTARARVAGGGQRMESTPSYLSGLLIGAEVASMPRPMGIDGDEPVMLLGDSGLCRRYGQALDRRGVAWESFDGEAAAVAGLFALHQMGTRA